jgi:SAM-dependent methyltransferase
VNDGRTINIGPVAVAGPDGMFRLNAGCGTHYADGWTNTDCWVSETTRPDVRVTECEPYPFPDDTFDAVYLGHVLEHIPWPDVVPFIVDMARVAKPGAPILAVGPDVYRTIRRWRDGQEPWHMVVSTMEHADGNYQPGREDEVWTAAHHHWNCHADRLATVMRAAGLDGVLDVSDIVPDNFQLHGEASRWWDDPGTGVRWPVVCKASWQCAAIGWA